MNKKIIWLIIGILLFSTANGVVDSKTLNDDTEYWALLIAVGIYADHPSENLPELLNIVDDLYDVLIKSGWSDSHIKVIKGKDATTRNIVNGLRWLDKMDDGNDITLVYLSTHGTSIPGPLDIDIPSDIPPIDEEDGCDEVLAGYWSFAHPIVGTIWDDELNLLISRLDSKGTCLIVYSCQSGGFSEPIFWNREGKVVLTACQEDERPDFDFMYYLIDGLRGYADRNSDGIVSVEEVFNYTTCRISNYHPTLYDDYPGEFPLTKYNKNIELKNTFIIDENDDSNKILEDDIKNKLNVKNIIHSYENSTICGYIIDDENENPIENAQVFIYWTDDDQYLSNSTYTNEFGFYRINVAEGNIDLSIYADEYFNEHINEFYINNGDTIWLNVTLTRRPFENSIICGYITDDDNNHLEFVDVNIRWSDENQHYDYNNTYTNSSGYYSINVAEGKIKLTARKDKYLNEILFEKINENEMKIINFSLMLKPAEKSIICGYITDSKTNEPVDARIYLKWRDDQGHHYNNYTTTLSGYYTINAAAYEVYLRIYGNGDYNYFRTYRNDIEDGTTLWKNFSLDQEKINVDISKPLQALYVSDKRIIPFYKTILIGDIEIEAFVHYDYGWDEPEECNKVEFYIDGVLKETDTTFPYTYTWGGRSFKLRHTIKVIAYDDEGSASDEISVWKL